MGTRLKEYNGTRRHRNHAFLTTRHLQDYVGGLTQAVVYIVYGFKVFSGGVTVGLFIAYVRVVHKLVQTFARIYQELTLIHDSLPALERVVYLMGQDTNLSFLVEHCESAAQSVAPRRWHTLLEEESLAMDNVTF